MREIELRRRQLVASAARHAVGVMAPEELVFFEPLASQYVRRGKLPGERRYADGVVGSGWDTTVILISPVALALANSFYNRLLDNVSDEVLKRGGHGLQRAWRRLRRTESTAPSLPGEPEARDTAVGDTGLREQLLSQAAGLGVPEEKALALVDALLAAVENGPPPQGAPESNDTGAA